MKRLINHISFKNYCVRSIWLGRVNVVNRQTLKPKIYDISQNIDYQVVIKIFVADVNIKCL